MRGDLTDCSGDVNASVCRPSKRKFQRENPLILAVIGWQVVFTGACHPRNKQLSFRLGKNDPRGAGLMFKISKEGAGGISDILNSRLGVGEERGRWVKK